MFVAVRLRQVLGRQIVGIVGSSFSAHGPSAGAQRHLVTLLSYLSTHSPRQVGRAGDGRPLLTQSGHPKWRSQVTHASTSPLRRRC